PADAENKKRSQSSPAASLENDAENPNVEAADPPRYPANNLEADKHGLAYRPHQEIGDRASDPARADGRRLRRQARRGSQRRWWAGLIGGAYGDPEVLEREFAAAGNIRVGCGFITWALARRPEARDE